MRKHRISQVGFCRFLKHLFAAGMAFLVLWTNARPGVCQQPEVEESVQPATKKPKSTTENAPSDSGGFERQAYMDSLEQVWSTINEKHFDPTFGGVDWAALKDVYFEKMEAVDSRADAVLVMSELLGELKLSHFQIIASSPNEAQSNHGEKKTKSSKSIGLSLRCVEGKCLVTNIEPDHPMYESGVRNGFELVQVGNKKLQTERFQSVKDYVVQLTLMLEQVNELLDEAAEPAQMTFLNHEGDEVQVEFEMYTREVSYVTFGNLPPFPLEIEASVDDEGIGYFHLSAFFDAPRVFSEMEKLIADHPEMKGLVIDLRDNPGGIGAMAMGMANRLSRDSKGTLGEMKTRDSTLKFAFFPSKKAFDGPVAILVNELSMSTSEIMAGGFQQLGRARIFGTRTPGAALPSVIEYLPSGDRFQYAFASFLLPDGDLLEKRGVIPDEEVPVTREGLLSGEDAALQAAKRWLASDPPVNQKPVSKEPSKASN